VLFLTFLSLFIALSSSTGYATYHLYSKLTRWNSYEIIKEFLKKPRIREP